MRHFEPHGLLRIQQRGVGDPEATYKIAQGYTVLGDRTSALRALRSSIDSGFFSYPYFLRDPLLNDLRGLPEFARVMNTARQRHEAENNRRDRAEKKAHDPGKDRQNQTDDCEWFHARRGRGRR